MRTETKYVLFLLVGGPVFGELLNGNHSPMNWLNPMVFIGDVMIYGCGALLIHELRARWGLQWTVILLSVAYAIIEEGLATKAFFNPNWNNGDYATYGNYFGVKWVWAIGVGFYHSTLSVLGPVFAAAMLWPQCSRKPLLRWYGLILANFFFWFIVVGAHYSLGESEVPGTVFFPHPMITLSAAIVVAALIAAAWVLRRKRVGTSGPLLPPWAFGIAGFAVQAFFVFAYLFKESDVFPPITITVQLSVIALALVFGALQVLNDKVTARHHASLLAGAVTFFLAITPIQIFVFGRPDMLLVGIAGTIALVWWFRRVAKPSRATKER